MRNRVNEAVAVAAIAAALAAVMAQAVLRSPSTRVFGAEIVGRHHDPFTVMQQFEQPVAIGPYSQPVTDVTGALIARVTGAVAAYNWLVLLTFPLAAAAAFLLARHLGLARAGATFAALAFAFSPFHVAQSAYHPQIAQVQWMPLYFLALWRGLERASLTAMIVLALATVGVALSNFYGGMIAAVITPVAVAAYWFARTRRTPGSMPRLVVTAALLGLTSAAGLVYVWWSAPDALRRPGALAFNRADLFRYSAKWWSYVVPPVNNPWVGTSARRLWQSANISAGLLEQQVTIGIGVVVLALIAIGAWMMRRRSPAHRWAVPILSVVAFTALVCSLSPERVIGGITVVRPSAWIYLMAPMFRSYARFGVVVQLMAALLAGLGLDTLTRTGKTGARLAAVALVALVVAEYAVAPSAQWRDVLPTSAHRWVMEQSGPVHALDCTSFSLESESVPWLTDGRISLLGGGADDCLEPHFGEKLAALGYTHLIVRSASPVGRSFNALPTPEGLRRVAAFPDGQVLLVSAPVPAIYVAAMAGFSPREHDQVRTWRWMSQKAIWTIASTTPGTIEATLHVELQAFGGSRRLEVLIEGYRPQVLVIDEERRVYNLAPWTLPPGDHVVEFRALEPPVVAGTLLHNGDLRRLSVAVGAWTFTARSVK